MGWLGSSTAERHTFHHQCGAAQSVVLGLEIRVIRTMGLPVGTSPGPRVTAQSRTGMRSQTWSRRSPTTARGSKHRLLRVISDFLAVERRPGGPNSRRHCEQLVQGRLPEQVGCGCCAGLGTAMVMRVPVQGSKMVRVMADLP